MSKVISNSDKYIESKIDSDSKNKITNITHISNLQYLTDIVNDENKDLINKKIEELTEYILPQKSYTRFNLILSLFAAIYNKPTLSSVCYSNSIAILISFQSTSLIAPESYTNLVNVYKSSFKFWLLNILSHYVPPLLFYKMTQKKDITISTVSVSCMLHLLWGKSIKWDLNKVYQINPPLNQELRYKLWTVAIISHYLVYFIPRKVYPWILPWVLPIGKRTFIKNILFT